MRVGGLIAALTCLSVSGGCTVVRIDGGARPTLQAGVLRIAPASGAGWVGYQAAGLGLVPGLHGATLGFHAETGVLIFASDACRIVLFRPRRQEVDTLAAALAAAGVPATSICSTGKLP